MKRILILAAVSLMLLSTSCNRDRKIIKHLQEENDILRSNLSALQAEYSKLKGRYATCVDSFKFYRTQVESANVRISELVKTLDRLSDTVAELHSQLDYWKPRLSDFQKQALQTILDDNGKELSKLVAFDSPKGWVCKDARDVSFLKRDIVMIKYRERWSSNISGIIILKVKDPNDMGKWRVVWQARI